jgi:predicted esterase YcpF (UPF0227 family)
MAPTTPQENNTRDRVLMLESDVKHLTESVDEMKVKLDEIHNLFMQARGARWVIIALAGVGGFVAGKLGFLFPLVK